MFRRVCPHMGSPVSLWLTMIALITGSVSGQEQPGEQGDLRIDPSRITESDPPPLPERVVLPMPPTFRIATDASQVPMDPELWQAAREALDTAAAWLRDQQHESGGWLVQAEAVPTDQPHLPSPVSAAVTALALKALVQLESDGVISQELRDAARYVQLTRNEDGSFEGGALTNYVTSTVVSALAAADRDAFQEIIQGGVNWLIQGQWDGGEGLNERQDWYGGAGYGNRGRPDMSNTQMMLEALYDAGRSPDEPPFQRALAFMSRAQNLKATNHSEWAGNDGGFVYTPANGGESMGSEYVGEGRYGELLPEGAPRSLRSYGSMTYAGFKSLLYAGLSPDDVRVRAAFEWIRTHWTFDENPGLGQQGLYYYYHAMARALHIGQQTTITDSQGVTHNWRDELVQALLERQADDGSWVNEADRWMEGEPVLVTVYAMLALEESLKPVLQAH